MSNDLIRPAADAPRWSRRRAGFIAGCFVTLTVGTTALDLAWPAEAPQLFGREAAEFQSLQQNAKWSDGTLAAFIDYRQRIESRTRRLLGPLWAAASVKLLRTAPDLIVLGRDDWMFVRARIGARAEDPEEAVAAGALAIAAFERRMAALNVDVRVLPVPRKITTLAAFLPPGLDPQPEIEAAMGRLLDRHGVHWLDLAPLLAQLPPDTKYWRYDPHWTYEARKHVARYMAAEAGLLSEPVTRLVPQDRVPDAAALLMAGVVPGSWAAGFFEMPMDKRYVLRKRGSPRGPVESDVEVRRQGWARLALAGTSFSTGMSAPLAHFTAEPILNCSAEGLNFTGVLGAFLDRTADVGLPELVWYEFPLHQAFGAAPRGSQYSTTVNDVLSKLPVVPVQPVASFGKYLERTQEFRLGPNRLITSGASLAYVRVRGLAGDLTDLRWLAQYEDLALALRARPEADELLIPILDHGPLGTMLSVRPTRPVQAELAVDLVTDLDLAGAVAGRLEPKPRRSFVDAAFDGLEVAHHDALVIRLNAPVEGVPITVTLRTADRRTLGWRFRAVGPAIALLSLDERVGERIEVVRVRGFGNGFKSVSSVAVARQARAGD